MKFSLVPREERFFDMFAELSQVVLQGARHFNGLLCDYTNVEAKTKAIKDIELEGDHHTHRIIEALNRSFVTPIDRDDIHALTSALDDILDYIEALAIRLSLFKVKTITPEMVEFGGLIEKAAEQINEGVRHLRNLEHLWSFCREIKRLENLGDDISRKAISRLFENGMDPVELIKLKEIYGRMEATMDRCEDVANVIETIVLKNG